MPAVMAILSFFALARRSAVRYPGWKLFNWKLISGAAHCPCNLDLAYCLHFLFALARIDSRCGDDNLSVNQFLVKFGVLALLVGGGDQSVSLVLEPFSDTQFVLSGAQKLWDLLGVLVALSSTLTTMTILQLDCSQLSS